MSRRPGDAGIKPRRALDCKNVTQIDVLEQHQILLVLSEKTLFSYSAEVLEPDESALGPSRRGRKISGANFFKVGVFTGQHLVCCVKTSAMSGTIKVFQPMDSMTSSKKKSGLSRMLAGGQDVLRPYKVCAVASCYRGKCSQTAAGILRADGDVLCALPQVVAVRWMRARV